MNITVFGASGAIGTHFIDLATRHGHSILAVYRTMPPVSPGGQVEILVNHDILNINFVTQAIHGADVVITTLGPNFVKRHNALSTMISPPDLHQRLARTLVRVIKDSGASPRVISVSTGSMGPADAIMGPGPRLLLGFFRTFVARNLRLVGKDLAAMEKVLAASHLDWYAVRPVKLTDGPLTECVLASDRFALKSISRADVAWLCWLLVTSVQKSWRHVPKRSLFPFALPSPRNADVKKIASCLQEGNRARKTKTHNILETAIVLPYYDKYPPFHPGEYDFHGLCCSLVVMV